MARVRRGTAEEHIFELLSDEYIVSVSGRCGSLIDGIQFMTNTRRLSPYFGGSGGSWFQVVAPEGLRLHSFRGRSWSKVDAIGPNWI
ncbi:Jacalin-like lectin domain-containing protein [Mycena galopus ATCC 62051]|nr:Jacalin-like lectin domain-containing protein [Mycena galopus ATCC 62051]